MTEYVFILADGQERFEFVGSNTDMHAFKRMHDAVLAMPVREWEAKGKPRADSNPPA